MIYTHKWTSAVPAGKVYDLAIEEWSERLGGLSTDEIKRGIDNLPLDWPPTPLEFRNLCRNSGGGLSHSTAAYRPFDKSTAIELKPDKELAVKSMQEIKRLLNKGD